jgi:predicted DNA binding CopG/RHH family protein
MSPNSTPYYDLNPEEEGLLDSLEKEEWVSDPDKESEITKLTHAARALTSKTRNINIRLSERDLFKLKAKAVEEGIPYQTLITSILHKGLK